MNQTARACLYISYTSLLISAMACHSSGEDDDSSALASPSPTPVSTPTPTPTTCTLPSSDTVQVIHDGRYDLLAAFPSLLLCNSRTIRLYLPASYGVDPTRHYPVLYMHDGQNLFDAETAAFGVEWQVDENVDALVSSGSMEEVIVVGMDNTSSRIDEYTPTADASEGGGKGDIYAHFVMDELKPYIDAHYSTLPGPEDTAVMGSSLGGLISCYMGWTYPDVFSMAGCVSSSFWWDDHSTLKSLQSWSGPNVPVSFWIDIGTAEGGDDNGNGLADAVDDSRDVRDQMLSMGYQFGQNLDYQEQAGAAHNEAAWASRVHNPLLMFFGTDRSPELDHISVLPYGAQVGLAGVTELPLEVNADFQDGLQLTVPNQLADLTSADKTVAKVSSAGVITGVSVGTTAIQADWQGRSASADIEVVASLSSDVKVTFNTTVPESTPSGDKVYIVGNLETLGGWDPAAVPMTKADATHWSITLTFTRGEGFQYKYTRGSWNSVEKDSTGAELPNREGKADVEKTIQDVVAKWADVANATRTAAAHAE